MEGIILNYISKNYKYTLDGALKYTLLDVNTGFDEQLIKVMTSLPLIFPYEPEYLNDILLTWVEIEGIKLSNIITDIQYKMYEETGLEVELSHNELVKLINEYEEVNQTN